MPKTGMEPARRAALSEATIAEVGQAGSLDVTVAEIARRAGMSSGLAHHYFGSKDQIMLAAMRRIMADYAREVLMGLKDARTPHARLMAIVEGAVAPSNFERSTISAWLNFYVLALSSPAARRLHRVYARRIRSNLTFSLRGIVDDRAEEIADRLASLIDGIYLNAGLGAADIDPSQAAASIIASLDAEILRATPI